MTQGKPTTKPTTDSLFAATAALLDAPDDSAAEAKAFGDRARILKAMTPAQKRRAAVIAAAVLHLTL